MPSEADAATAIAQAWSPGKPRSLVVPRGLLWVKLRKPHAEHMLSESFPIADVSEPWRHFREVPPADIASV
jgi:hypothetical protein